MIKSNDKKIIYIIFLFPGLFSRIGYSKIGIAYISDVRQKWWWSYWFQVNSITYPISVVYQNYDWNAYYFYSFQRIHGCAICDVQWKSRRESQAGMVSCYQNCSDLLWEKIVQGIEKKFWNSKLKAENFQKI